MARRRWEFDLDDGHHVVELDHSYFLGTRKLTVDGKTTIQSGNAFVDHSGEYPVVVGAHQATLQISTDGFRYSYDLVVDGRSVSTGAPARVPRPPIGPLQQQVFGVALLVWTAVLVPFFWTSTERGWGAPALFLALAVVGASLFYSGIRRARTLRRLKEKGELRSASVVKVKWGFARGIGGVGSVQYEYEDTVGRRHRGSGPPMYPAEAKGYIVGSKIKVLVDPERAGDSALP